METHPNLRNDLINVKTDGFCFDIFNADNDKSKGIEMILEKQDSHGKIPSVLEIAQMISIC